MAKPLAQIVDAALRAAGIPLEGISIGRPADRTTWSVQYAAGATAAQRAAGDALLLTVDTTPLPEPVDPLIQAIFEAIPNPKKTLAEVQAAATGKP